MSGFLPDFPRNGEAAMTSVQAQREQVQRAQVARSAAIDLTGLLQDLPPTGDEVKITVVGRGNDRVIALPPSALERLVEVLEALGDGQEPSVLPTVRELSTGEVAKLLGVSRQYATRLIDDGKLPSRRVGNRRRVRVDDALRYLRADNQRRVQRYREQVAAES